MENINRLYVLPESTIPNTCITFLRHIRPIHLEERDFNLEATRRSFQAMELICSTLPLSTKLVDVRLTTIRKENHNA